MYKKVDASMDFVEREKRVIDFWNENRVFEESMRMTENGEEFSFYDGPPTANGKPHIGHILTRVMKDLIPRYHTMKGKHVLRKAGWDTHGLPVELEVEKLLGIDGKPQIEKYGIEPFVKECKKSVWQYTDLWKKMSDRVGYWVDMDNPYVTYHDDYIESEWWAIKKISDRGLLYKGHKIVPYCPRCGTALSSHEVAQGYKEVTEKSAVAKFKVEGRENTYILAWTTTPWTLPSNVGLCMNPDEDYVEIVADGTHYIMAEALVEKFFEAYEIVDRKKGIGYEGVKYEPLFDEGKQATEKLRPNWTSRYQVVCDTYVTLTDGTGVVHIAPAFGADDYNVGMRYGLPVLQMVNEQGCFDERFPALNGVFAKQADPIILRDLKERGLLFKALMFTHDYPHCWRCDTPLLYYARSSWFVKVTAIKDELIAANRSVNWMPDNIKEGRMGNFLENVIDWGLSRDRYWGTPLPVWVCPDCGKIHVVGSKEELRSLCHVEGEIELHRPYLDDLMMDCACGGKMKRTPEVIDCWFDSGSMPFAQYHYPFENKEVFEKTFPADFISEAVDQTRGWFYTLLVISTLLFGKAPFKNCIVLGHVNDENGIKMSKHKGNVVDPWSVLDKQGADAVRWYFYTNSAPWLPSRFSANTVTESQKKYLGTLSNTYAFFVLYADIDGYNPAEYRLEDCKLTVMDRWVLSKLNTLIKEVDEGLASYEITETAKKLQSFVDELSNWYVRRCRERFWGKGIDEDKAAAYTTLYTVLTTVAKLTAPFTPFIAETIYQNLVPDFYPEAPKSVHLCAFPESNEKMIDSAVEQGMERVLDIVVLGRAARNASQMKNRQPLGTMYIVTANDLAMSDELKSIVTDELNIKNFVFADDAGKFVTYRVKPNFLALKDEYGKQIIGAVRGFLAKADPAKMVETLNSEGKFVETLAGTTVTFTKENLLIEMDSKGGFAAASDHGVTVALDTELTDELIKEGLERELVFNLQTMRKEAGFEVTDRIAIGYQDADPVLEQLLLCGKVSAAVLCERVENCALEGYTKALDIDGKKVTLTVVLA